MLSQENCYHKRTFTEIMFYVLKEYWKLFFNQTCSTTGKKKKIKNKKHLWKMYNSIVCAALQLLKYLDLAPLE